MIGNMKLQNSLIVGLLSIFLAVAASCLAKAEVEELKPAVVITTEQMQQELRQSAIGKVYVETKDGSQVAAYENTKNQEALVKLIISKMVPNETTYLLTNDKATYKHLYSWLRFYAGRNYDFGGYKVTTGKEVAKEFGKIRVYRLRVIKTLRSPKSKVQHGVYYPTPPSSPYPTIQVDLFGGSWQP